MHRQASDTTIALRAAIKSVLDNAPGPLAAAEICAHPAVEAIGVSRADATLCVSHLFLLKSRGFPMMRAPIGGNKFVYFNPEVVTPNDVVMAKAEERPPLGASSHPVNAASQAPAGPMKSGDFQFNPIHLETELTPAPAKRKTKAEADAVAPPVAVPAPVHVPAGVKCITLTVAGVSIKIELG